MFLEWQKLPVLAIDDSMILVDTISPFNHFLLRRFFLFLNFRNSHFSIGNLNWFILYQFAWQSDSPLHWLHFQNPRPFGERVHAASRDSQKMDSLSHQQCVLFLLLVNVLCHVFYFNQQFQVGVIDQSLQTDDEVRTSLCLPFYIMAKSAFRPNSKKGVDCHLRAPD